jgi:Tol biopolymer transport system component
VLFSSDRHQETSDEQRVFFNDHDVYWKSADGSGEAERLTYGELNHGPQRWTPDGKTLSFYEIHPETGRDVWMLPFEGDRKPWLFLKTPVLEGGMAFSADGNWIAHTSEEPGQREIVVRAFPQAQPMHQVSRDGGIEVVWPRQSRELFYRFGNKRMAVEITTSPTLKVGTPRVLFEGDYVNSPGSRASWDATPDGQRFLLLKKVE